MISNVLEHDLELSKLKRLLREGHNTYITATSKVTQQNAYNALTEHLLVVRDCALRLAMALDRLDTSEPFLWNGCDVRIALRSSLDFLGDCESLRSWYGDEYPYTNNPFALSLPLSECPKDTYVMLD